MVNSLLQKGHSYRKLLNFSSLQDAPKALGQLIEIITKRHSTRCININKKIMLPKKVKIFIKNVLLR